MTTANLPAVAVSATNSSTSQVSRLRTTLKIEVWKYGTIAATLPETPP